MSVQTLGVEDIISVLHNIKKYLSFRSHVISPKKYLSFNKNTSVEIVLHPYDFF
jgi:hypothetical protein